MLAPILVSIQYLIAIAVAAFVELLAIWESDCPSTPNMKCCPSFDILDSCMTCYHISSTCFPSVQRIIEHCCPLHVVCNQLVAADYYCYSSLEISSLCCQSRLDQICALTIHLSLLPWSGDTVRNPKITGISTSCSY